MINISLGLIIESKTEDMETNITLKMLGLFQKIEKLLKMELKHITFLTNQILMEQLLQRLKFLNIS